MVLIRFGMNYARFIHNIHTLRAHHETERAFESESLYVRDESSTLL